MKKLLELFLKVVREF